MKLETLTALHVALRTNIDILYFQCIVPLHILMIDEGEIEKRVFLSTWKDIPGEYEVQYKLTGIRVNAGECSDRLKRNNIFTIVVGGILTPVPFTYFKKNKKILSMV